MSFFSLNFKKQLDFRTSHFLICRITELIFLISFVKSQCWLLKQHMFSCFKHLINFSLSWLKSLIIIFKKNSWEFLCRYFFLLQSKHFSFMIQFFCSSDSAEAYDHVHVMSMFITLKCEFEILAVTVDKFVINVICEMIFQNYAD